MMICNMSREAMKCALSVRPVSFPIICWWFIKPYTILPTFKSEHTWWYDDIACSLSACSDMIVVWNVGIFVGGLIRTFGSRTVMIVGSVGACVSLIICSFSHQFELLVSAFAMLGTWLTRPYNSIHTIRNTVIKHNAIKRSMIRLIHWEILYCRFLQWINPYCPHCHSVWILWEVQVSGIRSLLVWPKPQFLLHGSLVPLLHRYVRMERSNVDNGWHDAQLFCGRHVVCT